MSNQSSDKAFEVRGTQEQEVRLSLHDYKNEFRKLNNSFYQWGFMYLTVEEIRDEYARIQAKQSKLSKRQRDVIEQLYMEKC